MMTNVTNNGFIPSADSFIQNLNLPATYSTGFDGLSLNDLIGSGDLTTSDDMLASLEKGSRWEQDYQTVLAKGDGNAAVDRIIKGLRTGIVLPDEAVLLAKQVQEQANASGGGRINGEMRAALKKELDVDVDFISKGKTRGQIGWEKFWNVISKLLGL